MPIEVITGQPGNGKTLRMMELLSEAAQKADRPIFAAGIDGLMPGIAEVLINPRDWNAILPGVEGTCTCGDRPPHAHLVPNGSLIFVDEAWKWFGHLHDARSAPTPLHVLALAEHRHRGLDFVMTTQMPNQLYPFMRGLIGGHTHVVRRFGTHFADLFHWGELCEDVKSQAQRERALKTSWRYPKGLFSKFTSATQHTIKRRIPWKAWLLPGCVVAAIFLAWRLYAWWDHSRHASADPSNASAGVAGAAADGRAVASDGASSHVLTVAEYMRAKTPRLSGEPWSAPMFDGRAVTANPELLCVINGRTDAVDRTCRCYTEQGTRYNQPLTQQQCETFAIEGVYNPFKAPPAPAQSKGVGTGPSMRYSDGSPPAQNSGPAIRGAGVLGSQAHYGQALGQDAAPDTTYPCCNF